MMFWLVPMKNIKSNNRVQKEYAILRIEIWVIRLFLNLRYYMKAFKSHSVFFRLRKIIFWNQTSFSFFTINIFKDFQSLSKIFKKVVHRKIRTNNLWICSLTTYRLRYPSLRVLCFNDIANSNPDFKSTYAHLYNLLYNNSLTCLKPFLQRFRFR